MIDWEKLIAAAAQARARAHAPYSGFAVGAALLGGDGQIYAGCNVENRSFGLSFCAERTALVAAVAAGCRQFEAAVVVADASPPASPCGPCREALTEFCTDLPILLVNPAGERELVLLRELLPRPFVFPPRG